MKSKNNERGVFTFKEDINNDELTRDALADKSHIIYEMISYLCQRLHQSYVWGLEDEIEVIHRLLEELSPEMKRIRDKNFEYAEEYDRARYPEIYARRDAQKSASNQEGNGMVTES